MSNIFGDFGMGKCVEDPDEVMKQLMSAGERKRVVTDIKVVMDNTEKKAKAACPSGYTLIDADLNKKSGGYYIYLCVKYEEISLLKTSE